VHTRLHNAPAIVPGCTTLTLRPPGARFIRDNAALTTLEVGVFDGLTVQDNLYVVGVRWMGLWSLCSYSSAEQGAQCACDCAGLHTIHTAPARCQVHPNQRSADDARSWTFRRAHSAEPVVSWLLCGEWVLCCCGAIPVDTGLHSAAAIVLSCVILTLRPPAARFIGYNPALTTLEAGLFDGVTSQRYL